AARAGEGRGRAGDRAEAGGGAERQGAAAGQVRGRLRWAHGAV
ncbi:MAG: hypothetical protein AVDCRST_MAG13-1608, partial [uncultured Solirubrobacteraceae bacterium]